MSVDTTARTRTLHSKRSFGKYPRTTESPAYDASEEDNDPLTDDGSTVPVSVAAVSSRLPHPRGKAQQQSSGLKMRHHLATTTFLSDSDGIDSPTYDGDVESSTAGHTTDLSRTASMQSPHSASSTSTLSTPLIPEPQLEPVLLIQQPSTPEVDDDGTREPLSAVTSTAQGGLVTPPLGNEEINPALFTPEGIQAFVKKAIDGESWRSYKINPPPTDRPVRVYADGVYDLFHFGHALQLRQAKLSFPSVYLLVGVNSDEEVFKHKSRTVMNHVERIESVRHCRWADQVVPEAPWIIDEDFLTKYQIDYVAHDELPYGSAGHDDVYALCKSLGRFIPTRRTPGVSTSDLLKRIVAKYRRRDFDDKLAKIGHTELCAEGSDWDDLSLAGGSSRVSRVASPTFSRPPPPGNGGSNTSGGGDGSGGDGEGGNRSGGYGAGTGWSHLKVEAPSASVSSAGASFGSSRSASPTKEDGLGDVNLLEVPVAENAR